jgi:hypothetical protein
MAQGVATGQPQTAYQATEIIRIRSNSAQLSFNTNKRRAVRSLVARIIRT